MALKAISCFISSAIFVVSTFGSIAKAETMTLEQKYQNVFVSAGYATALGAAVGAAMLSFKDEPTDHLRYVAVGASVGFFAGTMFGTYMVVAPSFALDNHSEDDSKLVNSKIDRLPRSIDSRYEERTLVVKPTVSSKHQTIKSLEAGMILAKF